MKKITIENEKYCIYLTADYDFDIAMLQKAIIDDEYTKINGLESNNAVDSYLNSLCEKLMNDEEAILDRLRKEQILVNAEQKIYYAKGMKRTSGDTSIVDTHGGESALLDSNLDTIYFIKQKNGTFAALAKGMEKMSAVEYFKKFGARDFNLGTEILGDENNKKLNSVLEKQGFETKQWEQETLAGEMLSAVTHNAELSKQARSYAAEQAPIDDNTNEPIDENEPETKTNVTSKNLIEYINSSELYMFPFESKCLESVDLINSFKKDLMKCDINTLKEMLQALKEKNKRLEAEIQAIKNGDTQALNRIELQIAVREELNTEMQKSGQMNQAIMNKVYNNTVNNINQYFNGNAKAHNQYRRNAGFKGFKTDVNDSSALYDIKATEQTKKPQSAHYINEKVYNEVKNRDVADAFIKDRDKMIEDNRGIENKEELVHPKEHYDKLYDIAKNSQSVQEYERRKSETFFPQSPHQPHTNRRPKK